MATRNITGKLPLEKILEVVLKNQQCILELDEKELEKQIAQRILEIKYNLQIKKKNQKKNFWKREELKYSKKLDQIFKLYFMID